MLIHIVLNNKKAPTNTGGGLFVILPQPSNNGLQLFQGRSVAVAVGFADQGVEFGELNFAGAYGGAGLLVEGVAVGLDGLGDTCTARSRRCYLGGWWLWPGRGGALDVNRIYYRLTLRGRGCGRGR